MGVSRSDINDELGVNVPDSQSLVNGAALSNFEGPNNLNSPKSSGLPPPPSLLSECVSVGASGGILSMWDTHVFNMEHKVIDINFLDVIGTWAGFKNIPIGLINMYAPEPGPLKEVLWSSIENLLNFINATWVIFGDFNAIRSPDERLACCFDANETAEWDLKAKNGLVTQADILKREERIMDLNQIEQHHREDLRQKSRLRWVAEGDENTSLLFRKLSPSKACYLESNFTMKEVRSADLTSRTMIGAGKRKNGGLFYFREMSQTRAFKTTTTLPFDLWHKRLGHPSLEVLKLLPQSEVFESMKMFLAMVKRQFKKHVKIVRSDNGTEFSCMKRFFLDEGIIFQTSCVELIVPSVNDNEYNDTGLHEEPPSQDRGNELVNEETTVHDNQTVRDDNRLSSPQSLNVEEQIQEENLRRGHHKKETSVHLRDYVTNTVKKKSLSSSTPPAQSRSSSTPYLIDHYVNCDKFSSCHRIFFEAIVKEREPTWTIEELPSNKRALGCKWVYKIKYKSDGTIERLKARLVILVTASKQWELHEIDVHNAFLHGDLEEENEVQLNVLVYVDDLIISGNDFKAITQFKTYLSDCFHMKDLAILTSPYCNRMMLYSLESSLDQMPKTLFISSSALNWGWGSKLNVAKGRLLGIGISHVVVSDLASSFGCTFDTICFNYLGLQRLKNNVWGGNWAWRSPPRDTSFDDLNSLLSLISSLAVSYNNEDEWVWDYETSGTFKVKTLSRRLQDLILIDHPLGAHHVWNSRIPRKVNICVWRASIDRLATRSNLSPRGVPLKSTA
nr:hypothetical protein [Tanacetum cinerariifolium]GEW79657.1 hypothetical protein [Tanacetum cinerariifolium]